MSSSIWYRLNSDCSWSISSSFTRLKRFTKCACSPCSGCFHQSGRLWWWVLRKQFIVQIHRSMGNETWLPAISNSHSFNSHSFLCCSPVWPDSSFPFRKLIIFSPIQSLALCTWWTRLTMVVIKLSCFFQMLNVSSLSLCSRQRHSICSTKRGGNTSKFSQHKMCFRILMFGTLLEYIITPEFASVSLHGGSILHKLTNKLVACTPFPKFTSSSFFCCKIWNRILPNY